MTNTRTLDLPALFYDDHDSRELPAGRIVKRLSRTVRVELTDDELAEIRSDAAHYADPVNGYAAELPGLVASARATLRRLPPA